MDFFLQQLQYLRPSWNTGTPGWYLHNSRLLCSPSYSWKNKNQLERINFKKPVFFAMSQLRCSKFSAFLIQTVTLPKGYLFTTLQHSPILKIYWILNNGHFLTLFVWTLVSVHSMSVLESHHFPLFKLRKYTNNLPLYTRYFCSSRPSSHHQQIAQSLPPHHHLQRFLLLLSFLKPMEKRRTRKNCLTIK